MPEMRKACMVGWATMVFYGLVENSLALHKKCKHKSIEAFAVYYSRAHRVVSTFGSHLVFTNIATGITSSIDCPAADCSRFWQSVD